MNKTYKYILLPLLEGKPLEIGDKVDGYGQEGAEVVAIMNEKMVVVRSTVKGGYGYPDVAYPLLLWAVSELKRHHEPAPEVLDADGVPIKVGDVVWFVNGVERFDVLGIESVYVHVGRKDNTSTDAFVYPFELTHRQPDSLERIEEDASKPARVYWGCYSNCNHCPCPAMVDWNKPLERHANIRRCTEAQTLDLLYRQRKVLEREQA